MKTIKLPIINKNAHSKLYNKPCREDYNTVIKAHGRYELEGNLPIIYVDMGEVDKRLLKAFQNVTYYKSYRTGGLKTNSSLLAFKPRLPLKDNFCSIASMGYNHPLEHDYFLETSRILAEMYKKHLPIVYQKHMDDLKKEREIGKDKVKVKLLDEYIIEGTPFTSGIVNKDNELKYHYDHGNIKDVYSAMIVLKSEVVGGYLSIPEYGVAFELKNNSVLFFNGQNLLHGVTPIFKTDQNAYRYSVVFYTLKDMWQCLSTEKELEESRKYYEEEDAK